MLPGTRPSGRSGILNPSGRVTKNPEQPLSHPAGPEGERRPPRDPPLLVYRVSGTPTPDSVRKPENSGVFIEALGQYRPHRRPEERSTRLRILNCSRH